MTETYKNHIKFNTAMKVAMLFATFCDKKNRGDDFTWETFPYLAGSLCEVEILTCLKSYRYIEEAKELAKNFAEEFSKELVNLSDYKRN